MQYRNITKLVIDKRKLDILMRIGCPDEQLLQLIKTGKFDKTGDKLIDDTLECLIDFKSFKNWGGNHNPTGKNQHSQKRGQVDHQVEHQVVQQDGGQVVDKDIDIDKDKNNSIKERDLKGKPSKEEELFNEYWKLYTPVKDKDGAFVAKGNKEHCRAKFKELLKKGVNYETIIQGLERYLNYCRANGHKSCGAEVFLNQRRFENDYSDSECVDSARQSNQRRPLGIVAIGNELVKMSNYDESDSIPF
ncbi:MAG: hypothetical protein J6S85_03755 [Methanobrevibacter sp.]|nr:hypothetical protein [Methanobrevibacter sp.]